MSYFQHEPDPDRKNAWRVVYINTVNGERCPLSQRFTKERTAVQRAYELQVGYERRHNRVISVQD